MFGFPDGKFYFPISAQLLFKYLRGSGTLESTCLWQCRISERAHASDGTDLSKPCHSWHVQLNRSKKHLSLQGVEMILPSLKLDQILWLSENEWLFFQVEIPFFFLENAFYFFWKYVCDSKFSLNTKEDDLCILNSVLYFEALEEAEKNHHKFCFRFTFLCITYYLTSYISRTFFCFYTIYTELCLRKTFQWTRF